MRNGTRQIINNRSRIYKRAFEERGHKHGINHFATPRLRHITPSQRRRLTRVKHTWKTGDRYYKLAHAHYGNAKFWWVIAWYNRRPTEAHVKLGDVIYIPHSLEDVLRFLGI